MEEMSTLGSLVFYPLLLIGLPIAWGSKSCAKDFIGEVLDRFAPNWDFNMETYSQIVGVIALIWSIAFCIAYAVLAYHFANLAGAAVVQLFRDTPWYVTLILIAGFVMRWYERKLEKTRHERELAKALAQVQKTS